MFFDFLFFWRHSNNGRSTTAVAHPSQVQHPNLSNPPEDFETQIRCLFEQQQYKSIISVFSQISCDSGLYERCQQVLCSHAEATATLAENYNDVDKEKTCLRDILTLLIQVNLLRTGIDLTPFTSVDSLLSENLLQTIKPGSTTSSTMHKAITDLENRWEALELQPCRYMN